MSKAFVEVETVPGRAVSRGVAAEAGGAVPVGSMMKLGRGLVPSYRHGTGTRTPGSSGLGISKQASWPLSEGDPGFCLLCRGAALAVDSNKAHNSIEAIMVGCVETREEKMQEMTILECQAFFYLISLQTLGLSCACIRRSAARNGVANTRSPPLSFSAQKFETLPCQKAQLCQRISTR